MKRPKLRNATVSGATSRDAGKFQPVTRAVTKKKTEIPSLVEDINLTGVNSGLKFKNIRLKMK